ncbi:hypothetical protein Zmor_005105 [Zophobas morio]|uniref:RPGRIP1 C-terminal domain-containing protein n=1 Tax=Zophobas morio TaxID=2755281 RepID=A0AA38MLB6_9CUCU|nr:hypothetical protein Zmor_005105 [Zophobas morio]
MNTFEDYKIYRVTPGKISKYMDDTSPAAPFSNAGAVASTNLVPSVSARFKMYLSQVRISKRTLHQIRKHLDGDIFITLRWKIFEIEDFVTSPGRLDQNRAKFDFTSKYQINLDQECIDKVYNAPMRFQIYANSENQQIFLGESHFFIEDLVNIVNEKQQQKVFFTSHELELAGEQIACLELWYKFTSKQKTLKALVPASRGDTVKKKTYAKTKIGHLLNDKFSERTQSTASVYVTDSEIDHFADGVWLVLNRNKVLKTTQSDINTELQERVRWLHFEANWKQTLQENAILHGKNPEKVNWRQWREEDTANVRLRTYNNAVPPMYPPHITITVVDLCFLEGCGLLRNDDIKKFYIEYSFLNYEGPKLETPFSLPKAAADQKITFNFMKQFGIDISENRKNCKRLTELIKNNASVKFIVISEPEEDANHPIQTCQEVGYAEVPLNDLVQLDENEDTFEYDVLDINNATAVLGYMTIKFEGILAMRRMALDMMAPKGYKLYV